MKQVCERATSFCAKTMRAFKSQNWFESTPGRGGCYEPPARGVGPFLAKFWLVQDVRVDHSALKKVLGWESILTELGLVGWEQGVYWKGRLEATGLQKNSPKAVELGQ